MDYYHKYLKYKNKYLQLKQTGGARIDMQITSNYSFDKLKNGIFKVLDGHPNWEKATQLKRNRKISQNADGYYKALLYFWEKHQEGQKKPIPMVSLPNFHGVQVREWNPLPSDRTRSGYDTREQMSHNIHIMKQLSSENQLDEYGVYKIPTTSKYVVIELEILGRISSADYQKGKVSVEQTTTGHAILNYSKDGSTSALNFGNAMLPCGKSIEGSGAQEESLCLQFIQLFASLTAGFVEPQNVYSGAIIQTRTRREGFKDTENLLLTGPITYSDRNPDPPFNVIMERLQNDVNVITIAGPDYRFKRFKADDDPELLADIRKSLDNHIKPILDGVFAMAQDIRCKNLILGAWGCGVYAPNPNYYPKTSDSYKRSIAHIFCDYILANHQHFDRIIFPIPDDPHFQLFSEVFSERGLI